MKIALIEIGGSHDECLYSQIKILSSVSDLTLICNDSLRENTKRYDLIDRRIFVSIGKGYKKWVSLFRLWRFLCLENYDKIIFNTAQGKLIKILLTFPSPKKTNFYGVLHDILKLNHSVSQKSISKKIKHYFILNDYLKDKIKTNTSFSTFYPIFYPTYNLQSIHKIENEIWVCIPGQVELKRRDYKTLFESIKEHGISKHIKFLLLGRYGHKHGDGSYIREQISSLSAEDNFLIWENFIPVETFHTMVYYSDYILPLIHKGDKSGILYENQISGAFNLALGYKKPLIVEKNISNKFDEALTYNKTDIMLTINSLKKYDENSLYLDKKWSFDFQRENYLQSIGIPFSKNT